MGCCGCDCCVRWIIGIVNIVIIIGAIVGVVLTYPKVKDNIVISKMGNPYVAVIFLVVVIIICLSCIFGMLLICCNNKCMKISYMISIIVIIILEIVVLVLAFVYPDKLMEYINTAWTDPNMQAGRMEIEKAFNCCYFDKVIEGDYECGYKGEGAPLCKDKMVETVKNVENNIGYCLIALVIVEILLLIFSIYLVCHSDKQVSNITDMNY